jgi:poly(A) polymerase
VTVSEPEIPISKIDINAVWVVRRLRAKGHEAYLTGGCVRDLLLEKQPKDFDVATNAKPEEIKRIFRNCRLIGRRFLLAHVFFPGGKIIEVATFRANPTDVQEDMSEDLLVTADNVYGNIEEDARRRDLTVNGLFYDPVEGKVIDYVGGREDLAAKTIRTIGDPEIRFREDPVRIMRAIKFASRLGFEIEAETKKAMHRHASEIIRCAPARVQEEMSRLLTSSQAKEALSLCHEIGVLDVLMPEMTEVIGTTPNPETNEGTKAVHDAWLQMLGGLDQIANRNCEISTAVAMATMLFPAYESLEKSEHNERNWIDKLCVNWAERIRLSRHDQDRIRILLSAINMFAPEKVSHKSAQFLVRKPWFKEALLLYVIYLVSRNEDLAQIGPWKALANEADKAYIQDRKGFKPFRPRFQRKWPSRTGASRFKGRGRGPAKAEQEA